MREAHLGVPAARSAAGTKIIYYDINGAVFLLPLQIRTYFIEMSREIRRIHYKP
jgi:hypothetical protein